MTQKWDPYLDGREPVPKGQAAFGLRLRRSLLSYHRGYESFFAPCLAPKSSLANRQFYSFVTPYMPPLFFSKILLRADKAVFRICESLLWAKSNRRGKIFISFSSN